MQVGERGFDSLRSLNQREEGRPLNQREEGRSLNQREEGRPLIQREERPFKDRQRR